MSEFDVFLNHVDSIIYTNERGPSVILPLQRHYSSTDVGREIKTRLYLANNPQVSFIFLLNLSEIIEIIPSLGYMSHFPPNCTPL